MIIPLTRTLFTSILGLKGMHARHIDDGTVFNQIRGMGQRTVQLKNMSFGTIVAISTFTFLILKYISFSQPGGMLYQCTRGGRSGSQKQTEAIQLSLS